MYNDENTSGKKTETFDIDSVLDAADRNTAKSGSAREKLASILSSVDEDDNWLEDIEASASRKDEGGAGAGEAETEELLSPEAEIPESAEAEEAPEAGEEPGGNADSDSGAGNGDGGSEVDFDLFENEDAAEADAAPQNTEGDEVSEYLSQLFNEKGSDGKPREKKKKTHRDIARDLGGFEEIDMSDTEAVNAARHTYSVKKRNALFMLCGTAVFFILGLLCELSPSFGVTPIKVLSPEFPALYALIDLQLLCFSAMCSLDSLAVGAKNIADRRFSPHSTAFCIAVACAFQALGTAFLASGSASPLKLFCTVGEFALLMLAAYEYLKASADEKSFMVASSSSNKFGAFETDIDSPDCRPFQRHINPKTAKAITVKKGAVYSGFVERNERRPEGEKKLGLMTLILLAVSVLTGVFMAVAKASVYAGLSSACAVFVASLPCSVFLVSALPKFIAAKIGKERNAALIGQNASEEYSGLSIVLFNDTEVFLPKDVRISSIKTYNGMELENAVIAMARIFRTVGGPLSKIFAKMLEGRDIPTSGVTVDKITEGSLVVTADGRKYTLATTAYLNANGIRVMTDSIDSAFEQSHGSLLHMLCDGRVSAKFYIKYAINPEFERTLSGLHDANLNVGIKSNDPCVDTGLIYSYLDKGTNTVSVIKGSSAADIPTVKPVVSSGVIALKSVHNFLEMLLLCESTGRCVKINNLVKTIAAGVSLVTILAFVFTNFAGVSAVLPLLLQMFRVLLTFCLSYLSKSGGR